MVEARGGGLSFLIEPAGGAKSPLCPFLFFFFFFFMWLLLFTLSSILAWRIPWTESLAGYSP